MSGTLSAAPPSRWRPSAPDPDLLRLYFDRSNALQNDWTPYVLVIGGRLALSTLRQRPDLIKAILASLLNVGCAYKNLSALGDVTAERLAILHAIQGSPLPSDPATIALHGELRDAMNPTPYSGVRSFHIGCDLLTLAAVWAMEWRRRSSQPPASAGGTTAA